MKNPAALALSSRKAEHPVDEVFLGRWSPRAMSGDPITKTDLMSLFEAARWAPSSYNEQPWRFIYALRDTPAWNPLFELMVEFNQQWTKNAAALVVIISAKNSERNGKPNRTHSFDTGSAWENLALQGSLKGLVVHGMAGFDYDRAQSSLSIPENFSVEAMAAIGHPAPADALPPAMRDKENPSDRKPLAEIVFEGTFGAK